MGEHATTRKQTFHGHACHGCALGCKVLTLSSPGLTNYSSELASPGAQQCLGEKCSHRLCTYIYMYNIYILCSWGEVCLEHDPCVTNRLQIRALSFSSSLYFISTPISAMKYSSESARRDLRVVLTLSNVTINKSQIQQN